MAEVVQHPLRYAGEIDALREILAQQTVPVSVDAALPRQVWKGEPDADVQAIRQRHIPRHLAAAVVGRTLPRERQQHA